MKKKKKRTTSKVVKVKPKTKTKGKPEENMERKALKVVASHLKDAGVEIKVLKKDDDATLLRKVNEGLARLPTGAVLETLESVSPDKLVSVLKRDCVGIFIDLSDPSCTKCQDVASCAHKFIENVTGGAVVKQLRPAVPPKVTYEPGRLIFVKNVKNPNPKDDDFHDTVEAILEEVPETMKELREIVERDFDTDDKAFLKTVDSLRKEGVVKLVEDLSEENKAELRKAGYDL